MRLPFFKLDGAGNDFVGLDWRGRAPLCAEEASSLARILTNRHHGIGADGILFLQDAREPGTHFTMLYMNADGSVGSMCGNGARCMAVFAHSVGAAPGQMRFLTGAGVYRADIANEGARVYFPDVDALPERRKLQGPLRSVQEADFLHVGVPHAVVFLPDLDLFDVASAGREIRYDPAFAPQGTNANFVELLDGKLFLRTYERGVEAETQACGTGSVATCCCYAFRERLQGRQEFILSPTSGIPLEIAFNHHEKGFSEITLSGPALIRFQGEGEVDLKAGRLFLR